MTATRFAFSSVLVLALSAFVCNAQETPSDMEFDVVKLQFETTELGFAECFLENPLPQDVIEGIIGFNQLECSNQPASPEVLDCEISGTSCQDLKSICVYMRGQIRGVSDNCSEISPEE